MEKLEEKLGLALRLANRLYPVTLMIGFLISLGAPVTYFVIESSALIRTATIQAQELSEKLEYLRSRFSCSLEVSGTQVHPGSRQ